MCLFGINTIRRGRITGTDKERLEFYIVDMMYSDDFGFLIGKKMF